MGKLLEKVRLTVQNWKHVRHFISFLEYGYLLESGWIASYDSAPVSRDGAPIPWLSLPFIAFIEDRLNSDMTMLEFGCGNSTHYFARRISKVISVEHDRQWYERISESLPTNAELKLRKLGIDYEKVATDLDMMFDLILVDGRERVECLLSSIPALTESGVLILDNSEREKYQPAWNQMRSHGFKHIKFQGMAPGETDMSETTVFYRPDNCLGI